MLFVAGEDHRREAAADDVRVLQQVAGLEIERVDVVRGEVRRIGLRRVAVGARRVLRVLEDVRGRGSTLRPVCLSEAKKRRLPSGLKYASMSFQSPRGELEALRRIREIEAIELRVLLADR